MSRTHTMTGDELPLATDARGRLYELVDQHHDLVWRTLRRLGVTGADTDDVAQQVFLVALRRLDSIVAGKERSFVYGVTLRCAQAHLRRGRRRREDPLPEEPFAGSSPLPDETVGHRRAIRRLEAILDAMPPPLREVFVLVEIEELATPLVGDILRIPRGTVCSRLKRARAMFRAAQLEDER